MMLFSVLLSTTLLGVIQCAPLEVTLSVAPQYQLGEEVVCEITLTNTFEKDLFLFTRHTPLRRFKSDIFTVTQNGRKIRYDALLFKHVPLDKKSDAILVPTKESVSNELDLSLAYALNQPGTYSVELTTDIFYLSETGNVSSQHLKSQLVSFDIVLGSIDHPRQTIGEKLRLEQAVKKQHFVSPTGVKDPLFGGEGDSVDKTIATTAWEAAYSKVSVSPAVVDKADDQYTTWFGAKDEGHMDAVKGVYQDIQKSMEEEQFTLFFKGPECERNDFAYTFFKSTYIYLCPSYFRAKDTHDYNSKMGTFINQLTHAVADLVDFPRIDTPEECKDLAIDVPLNAIKSASNYEYFCESII